MTKLNLGQVKELFKTAGLTLLADEYKGSKVPLLCEITIGRLAGYKAELTVDGVRQRLKGQGKDFILKSLTVGERKRYMKNVAETQGYTILDYPDEGRSTAPMRVLSPLGKELHTTWNILENNFNKKPLAPKVPIEASQGLKVSHWEHVHDAEITSTARVNLDKVTFITHSGEYAGCEGTMTLKNILQQREPTLRSLTETGLRDYCVKLCDAMGVNYITHVTEGNTRTATNIVFMNTSGVFKGYKGIRSISIIRQTLKQGVKRATIELLTLPERVRFMSDFANDIDYTITQLPEKNSVTKPMQLVCSNGHHWSTTWDNFYRGNRCPRCSRQYKGEQLVRVSLQEMGVNFKEQVPIRTEGTTKFQFLDFFIPELQLAIEYNGRQHYESVEQFGGATALQRTQILDQAKRDHCIKNGITLLEIPYTRTKSEVKEIVVNAVNTQQAKIQNNFE